VAKSKSSRPEPTAEYVDLSPLLEAVMDIPISNWMGAGVTQGKVRMREVASDCMLGLCKLLELTQAFTLQGNTYSLRAREAPRIGCRAQASVVRRRLFY
jgi:hypothetical protein